MSFEGAWKVEEQKSGYYNLVAWNIKNMSIFILFILKLNIFNTFNIKMIALHEFKNILSI